MLIIAVLAGFALVLFIIYYLIIIRQPVTSSLTVKPTTSNISSLKPIQQTSLQVTSLANNNQSPVTTVKINNLPVDVPSSGVVHQVVNDANGTTTIDVFSDSKSSGAGNTNSSMNIQVNSVSQSGSTTEAGQ